MSNLCLKIFASRAILAGECASELEIKVIFLRAESLQFIAGSEESPVSIAWIFGVSSSKHSSRESKPEPDPNIEK